jgi:phosphopantetheine adenylyltransferase
MLEEKELSNMIQEYQQRLEGLKAFFGQLMFDDYIAFPLHDRFGPAIGDADIEAIVITEGSREVVQESMPPSTNILVNHRRRQNGFVPLDVIEVYYVCIDTDTEHLKLSSTLLRRLEHDRKDTPNKVDW